MKLQIQNRRYIGNKYRLMEVIKKTIEENIDLDKESIFFDPFAGTGVVAKSFFDDKINIIVNDLLYSNYIVYKTWFSNENIDFVKISEYIDKFNVVDAHGLSDNYFSKIYSYKYFSNNDAKLIGYIREEIEKLRNEISEREYFYLLTSLMYATDKIANTVGHFEHFLKKKPKDKGLVLQHFDIKNGDNFPNADLFNMDANELVKKIEYADVVYIDPPYNARQYINFYHVLENLMRWDKPTKFEGISMKFKRDHLKSGYSRVAATDLFRDLIENINAKVIIVSYNNTYNAKSSASNNKISRKDLEKILSTKGSLEIKSMDYKSFNTGQTDFKDHKELLYICRVKE